MTTFALQLALPAKRFSAEPLAFVMMTIKQCIPGSAQDLLVISHHKKQRELLAHICRMFVSLWSGIFLGIPHLRTVMTEGGFK